MVRTDQSGLFEMMRWGGFLALSLLLNVYVLTLIKLPAPVIEVPSLQKFRIAFKSLAAPKSTASNNAPKPQKAILKPVEPAPKALPAIQTLKFAEKKIITAPVIRKQTAVPVPKIPTPRLFAKKPQRSQPVTVAEIKKVLVRDPIKTSVQKTAAADSAKRPDNKQPPKPASTSLANNRGADTSTVIYKARYRDRTPPVYPRRAYELGQQGLVMLHALVAANGLPKQLEIETSSGHRMLDRAALAAVKKWEFEPYTRDGQKIQSWVSVPVRFVIQ